VCFVPFVQIICDSDFFVLCRECDTVGVALVEWCRALGEWISF
jgi:hypothetical protein